MLCFTACEVREECDEYRKKTASNHGIWAGILQTRKK
jgi:hypothetical protein